MATLCNSDDKGVKSDIRERIKTNMYGDSAKLVSLKGAPSWKFSYINYSLQNPNSS